MDNMLSKKIFLMLCILLSSQIHARELLPDKLTSIDKEQVQQIQKMVDKINAMPLISDTVSNGILYFDKQGQLRKYFEKYIWESERGQTIAYYNKNRDLIYYEYDGGTNCDDHKEHYFVHKGHIIDGSYHYECGCCEEEDGTLQEIDTTWQITDTLFIDAIDEWKKDYIHADSLLNFLPSSGFTNAEYLYLLGTIPRQKADTICIENLKSIKAPFVIRDSIDNPKTYFIQYQPNGGNVFVVKNEDKYVGFLIFPSSGGLNEYSIERLNINGVGNDELIIRNRYTSEPFSEQISEIVVWDLDSYSCLLYIQNKFMSQRIDHELVVNLDKNRLSIQKVKDGISGLTYKYKLTGSGFMLDRVDDSKTETNGK